MLKNYMRQSTISSVLHPSPKRIKSSDHHCHHLTSNSIACFVVMTVIAQQKQKTFEQMKSIHEVHKQHPVKTLLSKQQSNVMMNEDKWCICELIL